MKRWPARIYVASSWRNGYQQGVVADLRLAGHQVYDFKRDGFSWSEMDAKWESWKIREYVAALASPKAQDGLHRDAGAIAWADTLILVQPCGRSAHLELGLAIGMGKRTAVYFPPEVNLEPELMTGLAGLITNDLSEIIHDWL